MDTPSSYDRYQKYVVRILLSTAAALLLCIGVVRLWPVSHDEPLQLAEVSGGDVMTIQMVQPTRQTYARKPPPPPPAQGPPVEVPDDAVLPEERLDLDISELTAALENSPLPAADSSLHAGAASGAQAGLPPKPIRFVEPEYTANAREEGIRARIVIEVLVDKHGRVRAHRVVKRVLLDEQGRPKRSVDYVGYGLEEAALSAVKQWRFRPGRRNGNPVSAYTQVTVSFGV